MFGWTSGFVEPTTPEYKNVQIACQVLRFLKNPPVTVPAGFSVRDDIVPPETIKLVPGREHEVDQTVGTLCTVPNLHELYVKNDVPQMIANVHSACPQLGLLTA